MAENLETLLQTLVAGQKELKDTQLKKEDIKILIEETLEPTNLRITKLEESDAKTAENLTKLEVSYNDLKKQFNGLKEEMYELKLNVNSSLENNNNLEQYGRKYSIKIFDLKSEKNGSESADECRQLVTKYAKETLEIDIMPDFISAAHRLPKSKHPKFSNQAPPMYVRFLRLDDKINFLRAYHEKGKGENKPVVKNDVTVKNRKLLKAIHEDKVHYAYGYYRNGLVFGVTNDHYRVGPIGYLQNLITVWQRRVTDGIYSPPDQDDDEDDDGDDLEPPLNLDPLTIRHVVNLQKTRGRGRGGRGGPGWGRGMIRDTINTRSTKKTK